MRFACVALGLLVACAPNRNAVQLSIAAQQTQAILASKQQETLDDFAEFVEATENQLRQVESSMRENQRRFNSSRAAYYRERVRRLAADALSDFDARMWSVAANDFERVLQEDFWRLQNERIDSLVVLRNLAQREAQAHPDDPSSHIRFP